MYYNRNNFVHGILCIFQVFISLFPSTSRHVITNCVKRIISISFHCQRWKKSIKCCTAFSRGKNCFLLCRAHQPIRQNRNSQLNLLLYISAINPTIWGHYIALPGAFSCGYMISSSVWTISMIGTNQGWYEIKLVYMGAPGLRNLALCVLYERDDK